MQLKFYLNKPELLNIKIGFWISKLTLLVTETVYKSVASAEGMEHLRQGMLECNVGQIKTQSPAYLINWLLIFIWQCFIFKFHPLITSVKSWVIMTFINLPLQEFNSKTISYGFIIISQLLIPNHRLLWFLFFCPLCWQTDHF